MLYQAGVGVDGIPLVVNNNINCIRVDVSATLYIG